MRGLLATALVVVAGAGALAATGAGGSDLTVQAEFTSARGLLEGNEVRVQGAPAGSIEKIELTDRNTALVTLSLDGSTPAPRSDAAAAIRPVDLLGDVYLSFSPGRSGEPLRGPIRPDRTSNAPRLDDLLRTFAPPVRQGMQALFVELGRAAELRGEDLGRAIVELRPALEAADAAMDELGSQNADLRSLIADAQHLTSQLARRNRDLGTTVDAFAATARETAGRTPGITRGLERLPVTLRRVRRTAGRLERAAREGRPLARSLLAAAPGLASVAAQLPGFLTDARPALRDTGPLLRQLRGVLRDGAPALRRLAGGARALTQAAPAVDGLMDALVPAAGPISEGFFVNFADQGAEPGTQPFDPTADPRRNYWRGAAVFTCEAFGLAIRPNCLSDFLSSRRGRDRDKPSRRGGRRPVGEERPAAAPQRPGSRLPKLPGSPRLPDLEKVLPDLLNDLPQLRDTPRVDGGSDPLPGVMEFLFG